MIRILVATADPVWSQRVSEGLRAAFAERLSHEVVGGALYALTSLERHRADLIVSSETLEDMSGRDLYDLVGDDAALRQLPFILLSGAADDASHELVLPDHQLVLAARAGPTEVIAAAFSLLLASGKLGETGSRDLFEAGYERGTVKVSGTLEALTLFDLMVSLGQGKRSGRLVVLVGDVKGTLYLKGGRLSHAAFAEAAGEDAVQKIFAQVHHKPRTRFLFAEGLPAQMPKTICTSLDKLLLQVAVTLDEKEGVPA